MTSIVSNILISFFFLAFLFPLHALSPDPVDAYPFARFCWLGPSLRPHGM